MPEAQNGTAGATVDVAALIREKAALLQGGDLYAMLGVERGANAEAIRSAYFALARVLHPDAVARQDLGDLKAEAARVYKAVTEAYQTLSDRRRRAEYEARLASGAPLDPRARDAAAEARIFHHKGSLLMQRRAFAEAETCFRKAVELDRTQARYMTGLGWAVMQNTQLPMSARMEEARRWFSAALELAPEDADAHYYMSLYWKALGDVPNQRKELQACVERNDRHVDALRELRLLTMRSRKTGPSSLVPTIRAFFDRLSGKKPQDKKGR